MSQPGKGFTRVRARVLAISVMVAVAGLVLGSAPAHAADELAITSVDVGAPAKATGVVRAKVNVQAPAAARLSFLVSNPAKGSASISRDGAVTYTPTTAARHRAAKDGAKAAERRDVVRVTVTDAAGQRASKAVRVPVLGANQAPVITNVVIGRPDPQTGVVEGRIIVTDADGDAVSYRVTSDTSVSSVERSITAEGDRLRSQRTANAVAPTIVCPSSLGSVSVNPDGNFVYTPTATSGSAPAPSDSDDFAVTVNDGYGGTTSVPVSFPTGSYGGVIQATAA